MEIADHIFPRMEEIFGQIAADQSLKSAKLKAKIASILYISNQLSICTRYKTEDGINTLVNFYISNLTGELDGSLTSPTEETEEIEK